MIRYRTEEGGHATTFVRSVQSGIQVTEAGIIVNLTTGGKTGFEMESPGEISQLRGLLRLVFDYRESTDETGILLTPGP